MRSKYLLIGIVVAVMLAGCSDETGTNGAADDDATSSTSAVSTTDAQAEGGFENFSSDYLEQLGGAELITSAREEGSVVFYSANVETDAQALADGFERTFPDIAVELVRRAGGEMFELIQSEAAAGRFEADVIEQSSPPLMLQLDDELGLIADYVSPSSAAYPESFILRGKIYPSTILVPAIAYNTELVDPADIPTSWEDFLNPAFDGRRGHVAIGAGGCAFALGFFQGSVLGKDYWQRVADGNTTISTSNGALIQQLSQGELMISTMNDITARGAMREGAPVALVYPEEGAAPCVFAAGVVAEAPHPNAARLFLNWLLAEEGGQNVWVNEREGISARVGMAPPPDVEGVDLWEYELDDVQANMEDWVSEWNTIQGFTP